MKRTLKLFGLTLLIATFLFTGFGNSFAARYEDLSVGKLTVEKSLTVKGLLQAVANSTGNVWYVDSGSGSNGSGVAGKSKDRPFATVDYAIGKCTANNGDIIVVMPGHAESFTAADGFDVDVAGVTIIMLGEGTDAPEFTFADTDATVAIGAANCTIYGGHYIAGISGVVIGIAVEAGGDNFTLDGAVFPEPSTSTFEFVDAIDLATTADDVTIRNCRYSHVAATGPAHFIEAGNGTNPRLCIENNIINGQFSVAAIWSDAIDLDCVIKDNVIVQLTSAQHAIEFTTTATGMIVGNRVYTDAQATSIDPGSMYCNDNLVTTAIDVSGAEYPVNDDGWAQLNATTLTAIEAEATDALEADVLDKLIAADDRTASLVYPDSVATESILAFLMSKSASPVKTSYNNTTDSLEAIRDAMDAYDVTTQADLDAILASIPAGTSYVAAVTSSANTTSSVYTALIGFGTNYFVNGWTMIVIWDAAGANAAPEGEIVDISAYVTASGTFTHGATTQLTAGDKVLFIRDEFVSLFTKTLPTTAVAGSLQRYIAGGDTGLGTDLGASKSLVDCIGTDGVAVADTATGIAGMIGVDDANNVMATTAVLPNADGSVFERLEYLAQMSEQVLAGMRASGRSVGNVFYCDSVTGDDGDNGTTWALAEATLDAAISDGTASKGDIVFVAPKHAETLGAAVAADIIGITVIGLGVGEQAPIITFDSAADVINVTVASVTLNNLRLYSSTIDTTVAIAIAAGGDYTVLDGLVVTNDNGGGFEFTDVVTLASGADNVVIKNCDMMNTSAGGNSFVNATAGAALNLTIENNKLWGDFTNAAIHSDQVNTNMMIRGNTIRNIQAGDHAIQLTAAATGYILDNNLFGTVPGAILDPGSCMTFNNNIDESDMTDGFTRGMKADVWRHAIKTFTLDGSSPDTLFTVTGLVEVKIFGHVTTIATAHGDTAAVGTAVSTVLLLPATAGTALLDEYVWTSATTADVAASPGAFIINDGDIILTQSGANLVAGVIDFHCYWRPLEELASVVAN